MTQNKEQSLFLDNASSPSLPVERKKLKAKREGQEQGEEQEIKDKTLAPSVNSGKRVDGMVNAVPRQKGVRDGHSARESFAPNDHAQLSRDNDPGIMSGKRAFHDAEFKGLRDDQRERGEIRRITPHSAGRPGLVRGIHASADTQSYDYQNIKLLYHSVVPGSNHSTDLNRGGIPFGNSVKMDDHFQRIQNPQRKPPKTLQVMAGNSLDKGDPDSQIRHSEKENFRRHHSKISPNPRNSTNPESTGRALREPSNSLFRTFLSSFQRFQDDSSDFKKHPGSSSTSPNLRHAGQDLKVNHSDNLSDLRDNQHNQEKSRNNRSLNQDNHAKPTRSQRDNRKPRETTQSGKPKDLEDSEPVYQSRSSSSIDLRRDSQNPDLSQANRSLENRPTNPDPTTFFAHSETTEPSDFDSDRHQTHAFRNPNRGPEAPSRSSLPEEHASNHKGEAVSDNAWVTESIVNRPKKALRRPNQFSDELSLRSDVHRDIPSAGLTFFDLVWSYDPPSPLTSPLREHPPSMALFNNPSYHNLTLSVEPPAPLISSRDLSSTPSAPLTSGTTSKTPLRVVPILGLFDLTARPDQHLGGRSELAAAQLALKHINHQEVIPGHELALFTNDTHCDSGKGVDAFFHAIYTSKARIMFLLGAACPEVTESLAAVVPYWNIVQVSFGSVSPALSDRQTFPRFIRTVAPDSSHNAARLAFLTRHAWSTVATISEDHDMYTLALNELVPALESANISLQATVTLSSEDLTEHLYTLKEKDCRIFIASFSPELARKVFCQVYHLGMQGPDYAWVLSGEAQDSWWTTTQGTNCTRNQLVEAVQGAVIVTAHGSIVGEEEAVSGLTNRQFLQEFSQTGQPMTSYVTHTYDAVWAIALALRKILEDKGEIEVEERVEEEMKRGQRRSTHRRHSPAKREVDNHQDKVTRSKSHSEAKFRMGMSQCSSTPQKEDNTEKPTMSWILSRLAKLQQFPLEPHRKWEPQRKPSPSRQGEEDNTNGIFKTDSRRFQFADFDYSRDDFADLILERMQELRFRGVSGPISFDCPDRVGVTAFYQIQGGAPVKVALYHPEGESLDLSCPGCQALVWPGGEVPASRVFKLRVETVDPAAFVLMSSLATLGILMALAFLVFNLTHRRLKYIKLSSPRLNNTTVVGSVLVYTAVILLGLDHATLPSPRYFPVVCTARAYLLSAGFSLAFGSMFTKTYRVHQIFTRSNSAGVVKNKLLKDKQLIGVIMVLLVVDVIIVSAWVGVDPMTRHLHNLTIEVSKEHRGVVFQPQVEVCRSEHTSEWLGALYVYKGLLVSVGVYMAWETRHVKIPALNDSQYLGMSVYNVVITSIIVIVAANVVGERTTLAYVIITTLVFVSTTTTLCLLFIPKILTILRKVEEDPIVESMGLKIQSNTRRLLTEDKRERFYRVEIQNKVYRRELLKLEQELQKLLLRRMEEDEEDCGRRGGGDGGGGGGGGDLLESYTFNKPKVLQEMLVLQRRVRMRVAGGRGRARGLPQEASPSLPLAPGGQVALFFDAERFHDDELEAKRIEEEDEKSRLVKRCPVKARIGRREEEEEGEEGIVELRYTLNFSTPVLHEADVPFSMSSRGDLPLCVTSRDLPFSISTHIQHGPRVSFQDELKSSKKNKKKKDKTSSRSAGNSRSKDIRLKMEWSTCLSDEKLSPPMVEYKVSDLGLLCPLKRMKMAKGEDEKAVSERAAKGEGLGNSCCSVATSAQNYRWKTQVAQPDTSKIKRANTTSSSSSFSPMTIEPATVTSGVARSNAHVFSTVIVHRVGGNVHIHVSARVPFKNRMRVALKNRMRVSFKNRMRVPFKNGMRVPSKNRMRVSFKNRMRVPSKNRMRVPFKKRMRVPSRNRMRVSFKNRMRVPLKNRMRVSFKNRMRVPFKNRMRVPFKNRMRVPFKNRMRVPFKNRMRVPFKNRMEIEGRFESGFKFHEEVSRTLPFTLLVTTNV
ncbi:uncharacterized protein LOC122248198 [Penaeus japonicus]|uniref:uncharacterized protein LOC122248198 n=1 Tax=Penaeus japonicus TaxID=27405 RepID=UPI001C70CFDF|nr:uncharacterized protein LOC122248198 [Penaeus japonicus]